MTGWKRNACADGSCWWGKAADKPMLVCQDAGSQNSIVIRSKHLLPDTDSAAASSRKGVTEAGFSPSIASTAEQAASGLEPLTQPSQHQTTAGRLDTTYAAASQYSAERQTSREKHAHASAIPDRPDLAGMHGSQPCSLPAESHPASACDHVSRPLIQPVAAFLEMTQKLEGVSGDCHCSAADHCTDPDGLSHLQIVPETGHLGSLLLMSTAGWRAFGLAYCMFHASSLIG